jgi:glycosyltransferase involved in cell wall biosynthesis
VKIAYVVRNGFFPPFNGERVKSAALATALASSGELTLIDLGRSDYPGNRYPDGARLELPYGGKATVHSMLTHGHRSNLERAEHAATSGDSVRLSRMPLMRRRAAAELLSQLCSDIVVVDHPQLATLALAAPARCRVVHAHNVESKLARSLAESSGSLRHRLRSWRLQRIEHRQLPRLDQVWAVSAADAEFFRRGGCDKVEVLPNVIPPSAFMSSAVSGTPGHAAFFGWMAYPPNVDAVRYLMGLVSRSPAIRSLSLVGRDLPSDLVEALRAHPRIRYLGYVQDLKSAVADAAVILAPLASGAGTKLKVIEALALGKPLVTTSIGAEGLDLVDGEHVCIAPLGEAFDAAAEQLLRAPALGLAMAERGRRHVAAHFSIDTLTVAARAALAAYSA